MRPGHGVILATVALLLLGVVMVNSVSLARAPGATAEVLSEAPPPGPVDAARLLWGRPTLYALLAAGMMLLGAITPLGRLVRSRGLASPIPWLVAGPILLLLLVYAPGIGREVNGARRWVEFGPLNLQPSEVAKWALPVVLAWWCVAMRSRIGSLPQGLLPPLALVLLTCGLVGVEDLGTAVLIFTVSLLLLLAGGVRFGHLLLLVPIGAVGAAAAILHSPYRLKRLLAWQDPFADPQGIGYHIIQSLSAIAGGGLTGRGLGHGVQKFGYLPEATTDFIFAIICEELGLLGAAMTVGLYLVLLCCGLLIVTGASGRNGADRLAAVDPDPSGPDSSESGAAGGAMATAAAIASTGSGPSPFSRLLGLGILLNVGVQALINVAVVVGLAPTKGIALPLVSHGGTGWLLTAFSLGVLISIEREGRSEAMLQPSPEMSPIARISPA
jgi:cell division protein FtsW